MRADTSIDRGMRIIVGIALVVFALGESSDLRWIGVVGPILIITALIRFCPANRVLDQLFHRAAQRPTA